MKDLKHMYYFEQLLENAEMISFERHLRKAGNASAVCATRFRKS